MHRSSTKESLYDQWLATANSMDMDVRKKAAAALRTLGLSVDEIMSMSPKERAQKLAEAGVELHSRTTLTDEQTNLFDVVVSGRYTNIVLVPAAFEGHPVGMIASIDEPTAVGSEVELSGLALILDASFVEKFGDRITLPEGVEVVRDKKPDPEAS